MNDRQLLPAAADVAPGLRRGISAAAFPRLAGRAAEFRITLCPRGRRARLESTTETFVSFP